MEFCFGPIFLLQHKRHETKKPPDKSEGSFVYDRLELNQPLSFSPT